MDVNLNELSIYSNNGELIFQHGERIIEILNFFLNIEKVLNWIEYKNMKDDAVSKCIEALPQYEKTKLKNILRLVNNPLSS